MLMIALWWPSAPLRQPADQAYNIKVGKSCKSPPYKFVYRELTEPSFTCDTH
jgi:hypothetical protein